MTDLPGPFLDRMKHMLKGEYQDFLASYGKPRLHGLRVNTMKITPQRFEEISPFSVKPIPWVKDGFYYEGDVHPASDPYYTAGLYYLQEPSAMTPASRLPIEKGDKVLDLCAAPGGKSTHLAARLYDTGILVANDISASRAKALLYNLEVFGAGNIFVTNEIPGKLLRFQLKFLRLLRFLRGGLIRFWWMPPALVRGCFEKLAMLQKHGMNKDPGILQKFKKT